jgi:hypothetical protein
MNRWGEFGPDDSWKRERGTRTVYVIANLQTVMMSMVQCLEFFLVSFMSFSIYLYPSRYVFFSQAPEPSPWCDVRDVGSSRGTRYDSFFRKREDSEDVNSRPRQPTQLHNGV